MSAPPATPSSSAAGSTLALYRRYRSATFAEVIGQEHITGPLSTALDAGRINHAYLFSGPRGCGKTSSARILARSLNCAQGPTATPCGVCDSCRELAPNGPGSIDVIEIDAASHGGVDDARDLRERAYYAPVRDRFKVYIIDEAHMVTTQGFNALLKLVEEPPDFLIFVFATTEPDKVLQTIRSRTHHYPFRLIAPGALRAHLERICTNEGVSIEPAVFPLVVRAGGGSARDALSLLDQLLAGAGPAGVTYPSALALLGVTDAALLDDMIDALAVSDAATVYATVDRIVEAGHEPRRFAADLLDRLRDLLVIAAVPEATTNGLIDAPAESLERMAAQAERIGPATAARWAEIVHTALTEMRGTTAPRLVLELVCARMLLPDSSADSAALLQRLERLERRIDLGATATHQTAPPPSAPLAAPPHPAPRNPAPPNPRSSNAPPPAAASIATAPTTTASPTAAPAKSAPAKEGPPAAPADEAPPTTAQDAATGPDAAATTAVPGQLDAAALRAIWPSVMERVNQASRVTHALMETVQVAALNRGDVQLVISTPTFAKMLAEPRHTDVIAAAIAELLSGTWTITVTSGGGAPATVVRPAATASAPVRTTEPESSSEADSGWPSVTAVPAGPTAAASAKTPSTSPTAQNAKSSDEPSGAAEPSRAPAPKRGSTASKAHPSSKAQPLKPDSHDADPDPRDEPADPDDDEAAATARHDPTADALALLQTGLGARPVDN